jgi:hypothetical protein
MVRQDPAGYFRMHNLSAMCRLCSQYICSEKSMDGQGGRPEPEKKGSNMDEAVVYMACKSRYTRGQILTGQGEGDSITITHGAQSV